MSDECGSCKFWAKRSDELGNRGGGYCRRFPPSFPSALRVSPEHGEPWFSIEPEGRYNDAYPMVHQQSWCGEFQFAPPNQKEAKE